MWFSAVSVVAAARLFVGVAAHGFDWVDTLSHCWQQCLSSTSDGCDSQKCICDASQNSGYLTSAVECAVSKCKAEEWALELAFLGPVELFCAGTGEDIPEENLSSAYACAGATATATATTEAPSTSTRTTEHKSTKEGSNSLKSTVTTTITQTTTDRDGNTLQIIVPIVLGPSTMSTGGAVTSTLGGKSASTSAPSSASASPTQTSEPSTSAATQAQGASSSGATAQSTHKSNSNGSPFENMQAGASQWRFSGLLVGLGLLAGVFMRL